MAYKILKNFQLQLLTHEGKIETELKQIMFEFVHMYPR